MNKKWISALPLALLAAGCLQDASTPSQLGAPTSDLPSAEEPAALPEGRNFLLWDKAEDGTPVFLPVEFQEDVALVEGDIAVAQGAEAVAALREKLVDPRDFEAAPEALGKTSTFYLSTVMPGLANAWPGAVVPYKIDPSLTGSARTSVNNAIVEWNQVSPVAFIPHTGSTGAHAVFKPIAGNISFSSVGMVATQPQTISISSNAGVATVLHEMGHAAGLLHEHTRSNRGSFVTIATAGTDLGGVMARDYNIRTDGSTEGSYDLTSIMHYSSFTNTYQNPDGSYFFAQVAPLNGSTVNNQHLSAKDIQTLFKIQLTADPFRNVSTVSESNTIATKLFVQGSNGRQCYYYPGSGFAYIYAVERDGKRGSFLQSLSVGTNYTHVAPYSRSGTFGFILFYNKNTGAYTIYKRKSDGTLDGNLTSGTLDAGYTNVKPYTVGTNSYLFLQNTSTFAVRIYAINSTGVIGGSTYSSTWSNWHVSEPVLLETAPFTLETFFLFRGNGDGKTRIRKMNADGTLGSIVEDRTLVAGASTVGVFQSGLYAHVFLNQGNQYYAFDFDASGFKGAGAVQRSFALGKSITHFDAANHFDLVPTPVGTKNITAVGLTTFRFSNSSSSYRYGKTAPFL